jgi:hypothetical protein
MFKTKTRILTSALLLVLLAGPTERAFSSTGPSTGPSTGTSSQSGNPPSATSNGITGTDPEPIEPDIVALILTLFGLA